VECQRVKKKGGTPNETVNSDSGEIALFPCTMRLVDGGADRVMALVGPWVANVIIDSALDRLASGIEEPYETPHASLLQSFLFPPFRNFLSTFFLDSLKGPSLLTEREHYFLFQCVRSVD
jgi:hypothetical protein